MEYTGLPVMWEEGRMPDDIYRMLKTSPLMAGLDPGLLGKMAAAAMPRRLGKGVILFRQGDRAGL